MTQIDTQELIEHLTEMRNKPPVFLFGPMNVGYDGALRKVIEHLEEQQGTAEGIETRNYRVEVAFLVYEGNARIWNINNYEVHAMNERHAERLALELAAMDVSKQTETITAHITAMCTEQIDEEEE